MDVDADPPKPAESLGPTARPPGRPLGRLGLGQEHARRPCAPRKAVIMRLRVSISLTTRDPRPGEVNGVHYSFVTRDFFEAARDLGGLLEWAEVHGHFYGTPSACRSAGPSGQGTCMILVIDVQGAMRVREKVPNALLVFVHAPDPATLEAEAPRGDRLRGTDASTRSPYHTIIRSLMANGPDAPPSPTHCR